MIALAVVAALGWVLAALVAGLYLGERGRRLDAQAREALAPPPAPRGRPRAVVLDAHGRKVAPGGSPADAVLMPEEREQMIKEFMAEAGCSYERAAAEVDRIHAELAQAGAGGGIS